MKIAALLTGRGNNSLRDKNVRLVNGFPLLAYPAAACRKSRLISDFFVSSEDEKILAVGESYGYQRVVRPAELALPTSLHYDVILHGLSTMAERGVTPDVLVVVLANSATIETSWIDDCINLLIEDNKVTAAVPVLQDNDHHPFRAKTLRKDGFLESFFDSDKVVVSSNRQSLSPCYFLCHNFWVLRVNEAILKNDGQGPWTFMGKNVLPYVVKESFDVHTEHDLELTAQWVEKMGLQLQP